MSLGFPNPSCVPPGTMVLWGGGAGQYVAGSGGNGSIAIPGWLYCDGSAVSTTIYATLFEILSTRYNTGGEPVGTFRLPGVAGYVAKGTVATDASRATATAAHTHALTLTQGTGRATASAIEGHDHTQTAAGNTTTSSGHTHGANIGCSNNTAALVGRASGTANGHLQTHTHPASASSNDGSGVAHSVTFTWNSSSTNNHNHNAPTISFTAATNYNNTSVPNANAPIMATVDVWHIIKT
jgi:microcystin-dependent protein